MAVTLRPARFSQAEIDVVEEAVLSGRVPDELSELEEIALRIAEQLPAMLVKARLPDNSTNRQRIVRSVLERHGAPKHRISKSYRQFR